MRLLLLMAVASLSVSSARAQRMDFNSTWWNHALSDEQQGFIYGNQDCRQPKHAASGSIVDYQEFVTNHISKTPNSAITAIKTAEHEMKPRKIPKGGETWSGPHGYLNGGWWGLPDLNSSYQQRGFVEGYMSCAVGQVDARAVQKYVDEINKHYARPKTENDAIASVLQPLLFTSTESKVRHR